MCSFLLKSFYNSRAQVAKDHLWWNHMYKDCNLSHSILKTLSPHSLSPIFLSSTSLYYDTTCDRDKMCELALQAAP